MSEAPLDAARASGLVRAGEPLLVLVSGGGDSVCLLDVALRLDARVSALHVNYGLREGADGDEAFVRELCERLRVPLHVEHVRLPEGGNLQEHARDERYALAERLGPGDYAAAHTASDQAETVLYRLAVSPGSRALHGMAARRGRLVRPLLAVTRDEVRAYLRARGLEWREDPSNADRRFARARVRHDLLAALREIGPAPERTIAATAAQLREEAELLERAVDAALEELGGGPAVSLAALREQPPALRRLVLRRLAGDRPVPDEVLELDERGSSSLDLGEGLRAVAEYGTLRFTSSAEPRGAGAGGAEPCPAGRASEAGSSRPPREWRATCQSQPRRSASPPPSARGAPVTACARSASAGPRRFRICSRIARSRARCGARCRWWRSAARSPGWRAWRSTSASRRARASRPSG